jgi:hypothetical protein
MHHKVMRADCVELWGQRQDMTMTSKYTQVKQLADVPGLEVGF